MKYLDINLTNSVLDIHAENYNSDERNLKKTNAGVYIDCGLENHYC